VRGGLGRTSGQPYSPVLRLISNIQELPDELAQILDVASDMAALANSDNEHQRWFIVRAAIWSSWQRCVMLYYWRALRDGLEKGFGSNMLFGLDLRNTTPTPGKSIRQMSKTYSERGKSISMCSWALGLLRSESVCISMDLRMLHTRYNELFSNSLARCNLTSGNSCSGVDPGHCRRFTGLVVKDQSMHDYRCTKPCKKLPWDESSYREIKGARAVHVNQHLGEQWETIRYCEASRKTMAISHVWSHGQGGRPQDGINACLHRRYVDIAKAFHCDSYWWDSICIPEDHDLRSEAIGYINSTFANSKVTLVCDKDIMGIELCNPTTRVKESVLATALVCDWNIRAWTFLESLRGRHQIQLLCKDNLTVSFQEVVKDVFLFGNIDLAVLSLAVPHMLPQPQLRTQENGINIYSDQGPKTDNREMPLIYLTKEGAGSALSYRPASRKGDDVVIWSLLTGASKSDNPKQLWQENFGVGDHVHTGFLMSSAPRLNVGGWSWAPSTSYFKSSSALNSEQRLFRAFTGEKSMPAYITTDGLKATWLAYELNASRRVLNAKPKSTAKSTDSLTKNQRLQVLKIRRMFLRGCPWGLLLQPVTNYRSFERDEDISATYKGLDEGTLIAVLGSRSIKRPSSKPVKARGWTWKGVYFWRQDVALLKFTEAVDMLIE